MKKPRDYELHQRKISEGVFEGNLYLSAYEDGDRSIWITCTYDIQLRPINARALAKRLNAMADWVEGKRKDD